MSTYGQADWLAGAMEAVRQKAGTKRTRKSYGLQDDIDRMISVSPTVPRIQILASPEDVRRFAVNDGGRLMYRGREIVPVRYRDPNRPWLGVVPV